MKNTIPTASERNLCFRSVKPGHQQHRSENMAKTNLNRSLDSVKKINKLILIFLLKWEEHTSLDSCFRANSTNKSRQSKPFQEQSKKKPNNNCKTPRKKTARPSPRSKKAEKIHNHISSTVAHRVLVHPN
jgi:hypothetical protein